MNQLGSFCSRFCCTIAMAALFWVPVSALAQQPSNNQLPVPASPQLERPPDRGLKVRTTKLLGSDADGDTLSILSVDAASARGAVVTNKEGWIHYSPPTGLNLEDSFSYTVGDGRGGVSVGTVTLLVTNTPVVITQTSGASTNNAVRMTGSGIPGRAYTIEFAEDAAAPVWQRLETVVADQFGTYVYTDHPPGGTSPRAYRARTP